MQSYFHRSVSYRKRKTRIALFIRLACVGTTFAIYIISIVITDHGSNGNYGDLSKGEKLAKIPRNNASLLDAFLTDFPHSNRRLLNINAALNYTINPVEKFERQNGSAHFAAIPIPSNPNTTVRMKRNCTKPAIFEFPSDGLTRDQRQHGLIVMHLLVACYCFWLLAVVCDDYFVPVIEMMCLSNNLKKIK